MKVGDLIYTDWRLANGYHALRLSPIYGHFFIVLEDSGCSFVTAHCLKTDKHVGFSKEWLYSKLSTRIGRIFI